METITAEMELQKRRFKEVLDEIFSEPYTSKIALDDDGNVAEARINTKEILDDVQLTAIGYKAEEWSLKAQLSRSGAGIKVEFKLKEV